ncbi:hypothetical protein NBRC110019_07530 [Neptunitalea chrysea]|uniref:Uncharacterized protein n=1 Tax=Neptunitalea chrysea TaxID=1647581 RepID=A0A9W6B3E7_9FLAO|nr:hypothetical protein [Neptunitalea chrysea]GLB51714.1 hypothetical protein NBRC110019_07530 [Neptunitalea chrysea]
MILKRLIGLLIQKAPKEQFYLELGSYFIRKGTGYQVGDAFEYKQRRTGKAKTLRIQNLFYNFKENRITYRFDKKPILNSEAAGVEERG